MTIITRFNGAHGMAHDQKKNVTIPESVLAEHWFSFMHGLLGEIQRAYRRVHEKEGLTQKDIAQRLNRDQGFISRRLRGQQNMTVRTMNNIARAMGCRLNVSLDSLDELPVANKQPRPSWTPLSGVDRKDVLSGTSGFGTRLETSARESDQITATNV